jgi:amino acid transporter
MILAEEVMNAIAVITTAGIVITFLMAAIFGVLFIVKAKWSKGSWVKVYITLAYLAVAVTFTVLLVSRLEGSPLVNDVFSIIAIRPVLFFLGGAVATSSFYRYIALVYGGDLWTLRRSKIS